MERERGGGKGEGEEGERGGEVRDVFKLSEISLMVPTDVPSSWFAFDLGRNRQLVVTYLNLQFFIGPKITVLAFEPSKHHFHG
jgi:hypothetical protein